MLIGEKLYSSIVWIQIYETTQALKEEELRQILNEVKTHILKKRIKSGSARKFNNGKLLYYEMPSPFETDETKMYCLFTHEKKGTALLKKSIEVVANRSGGYSVYSAKRFFSEVIDLVTNPQLLTENIELTEEEVNNKINDLYTQPFDMNELGRIVTFLKRSEGLEWEIVEKIYLYVYETLQFLLEGSLKTDPDEFLDASYIIARSYEEIDNYQMGLELLKYISLVAAMNQRFDLETACKIRIANIYKQYFPPHGDYILEALSTIAEYHILEMSKPDKEAYYSLIGHAHVMNNNDKMALQNYEKAIEVAGVNVSAPLWIAEAYNYLGENARQNYYMIEASRLFLTAATVTFSEGDMKKAEIYRTNAAKSEILVSSIYVKSALDLRMENNIGDAEYRAWLSLRNLIKAFIHGSGSSRMNLVEPGLEILREAEFVLHLPGKIRKNRSIINKIRKLIMSVKKVSKTINRLESQLEDLERAVEANIVIPPPTFMLITVDGRLVLMGTIVEKIWEESQIRGVILGGILVAIMSLISEVAGKTSLRTIDAGNFKILIERSENGIVALLLDREIPEYREKLQITLNLIDDNYHEILTNWTGEWAQFDPLKIDIVDIFSEY